MVEHIPQDKQLNLDYKQRFHYHYPTSNLNLEHPSHYLIQTPQR